MLRAFVFGQQAEVSPPLGIPKRCTAPRFWKDSVTGALLFNAQSDIASQRLQALFTRSAMLSPVANRWTVQESLATTPPLSPAKSAHAECRWGTRCDSGTHRPRHGYRPAWEEPRRRSATVGRRWQAPVARVFNPTNNIGFFAILMASAPVTRGGVEHTIRWGSGNLPGISLDIGDHRHGAAG